MEAIASFRDRIERALKPLHDVSISGFDCESSDNFRLKFILLRQKIYSWLPSKHKTGLLITGALQWEMNCLRRRSPVKETFRRQEISFRDSCVLLKSPWNGNFSRWTLFTPYCRLSRFSEFTHASKFMQCFGLIPCIKHHWDFQDCFTNIWLWCQQRREERSTRYQNMGPRKPSNNFGKLLSMS